MIFYVNFLQTFNPLIYQQRSQFNISSITDFPNPGNIRDDDNGDSSSTVEYCCPKIHQDLFLSSPPNSESQMQQRQQSYFDFENSLKYNFVGKPDNEGERSDVDNSKKTFVS